MELTLVGLGKTQSETFPFRDDAGRVHHIALDEVERIAWRDAAGHEGMVSSRHYSFVIPGKSAGAGRFSRDGGSSNPKRLRLKRRDGSDEMDIELDLIYMVRWLDKRGYEHALERDGDLLSADSA